MLRPSDFAHDKIQRKCHHHFSFLIFSIIMLYEGGFYIGQIVQKKIIGQYEPIISHILLVYQE